MFHLLLVATILVCAYRVVQARRLINVTIWLAVTSAMTAMLIYLLGAPEVAVIELSVGAGLVTVLFVFAFTITGETTLDVITLLPRGLVWIMVLAVVFILGWLILPVHGMSSLTLQTGSYMVSETDFGHMLWQQRGLDVVAQMVLIFAGVMGLLGLLSTSGPDLLTSQRERAASDSAEEQPDLLESESPEIPQVVHVNGHHQSRAAEDTPPGEVKL
jgi:uncharacterized MnhB-related membrane protein